MISIRPVLLLSLCLCATGCGFAAESSASEQSRLYSKFETLIKSDNFEGARKHLAAWEARSPEDVELAIAQANLRYEQAGQPITLSRVPETSSAQGISNGKDSFVLVDPKTNKPAGVLDLSPRRDRAAIAEAISLLADAVTTHPERLDIRFGLAHLMEEAGETDRLDSVLRETAAYASRNPDKLRWKQNKDLPEKPGEFVPKSLHHYAVQAFQQETPPGDERLGRIARMLVEFYPKHPYGYNDLAIYHNLRKENDKALNALLQAHKLAPDDALVTRNIASAYERMGDKPHAREFYQKTLRLAEEKDLKEEARDALKKLK